MSFDKTKGHSGFSMIELMIVCVIMLTVAGFAVPNMLSFIHTAKLRGSASDYASLLQVGRIRSVQDDAYYSTYLFAGTPEQAYVDLTKNGGTAVAAGDPTIEVSSEVTPKVAGSAPDKTNLQTLFLPTGASTPTDGTAKPVIFGPRGLPCATQSVTGPGASSGTICTGNGTSFWTFFEDTITSSWEAVTVSPAGRVQKWQHGTGGWSKL